MPARYYLTTEAVANMRAIAQQSVKRWGKSQAKAYQADLTAGFRVIAERHERLPRKATGVDDQRLHRVNHHYVVFLVLTPDVIVITTILHEHMDVPTRLHNAQVRMNLELADVRRSVLKDNLSGEG